MGNSGSKILQKLFCCCGPGTTDSAFELSSNPRHTGSGDSIRSDTFDEATQVIVHDTRTNRNYVLAKEDVENNPLYMVVLLPERCNETVVELEIPGSSLPYTLCTLNFGELGLKTKRQQGLIPYIFVTLSQPPGTMQSSAASRALGGNATGATQPSTRSISSPSQRSPSHQRRPSSSRSGLNQITPGAAAIPQPHPSTPSGPQPIAPRTVVQPQPRSSSPPSRPQPVPPGTAVQPQIVPRLPPSPSQPSIPPPPSQTRAPSSSSGIAPSPRPRPTSLSIPPIPSG